MAALPVIWMLAGLIALLVMMLVVVILTGGNGGSGRIGFGIRAFDTIERASGRPISKTTRLLWAIGIVALLLAFALYLRLIEKGDV